MSTLIILLYFLITYLTPILVGIGLAYRRCTSNPSWLLRRFQSTHPFIAASIGLIVVIGVRSILQCGLLLIQEDHFLAMGGYRGALVMTAISLIFPVTLILLMAWLSNAARSKSAAHH